jgi:tryptophan synthase alpha chain
MELKNTDRISRAFSKGKLFIGFVTAGDPSLEATENFVLTMEKAGADIIELGIPFSDPVAEGVIIQEANIRALNAGTNLKKIFALVETLRKKTEIPLVFLTYFNPVFRYKDDQNSASGCGAFFARCEKSGVDGIIIPDLPFEEYDEVREASSRYNVSVISLVAPTSEDRIAAIARESKGFLYVVSSLGVTGVRDEIKTDVESIIKTAKKWTKTPCAVGFGINTPEQAGKMAKFADGVIVGSAIVKIIANEGTASAKSIYDYVRKMKDAIS